MDTEKTRQETMASGIPGTIWRKYPNGLEVWVLEEAGKEADTYYHNPFSYLILNMSGKWGATLLPKSYAPERNPAPYPVGNFDTLPEAMQAVEKNMAGRLHSQAAREILPNPDRGALCKRS